MSLDLAAQTLASTRFDAEFAAAKVAGNVAGTELVDAPSLSGDFTLQPVSFPGASLALFGRTIHPGQQGGLHVMRDIPRYVKLIERGVIDAKSVITRTYTLDQSRQAVQDTGERTIITGVIEFT
jgi:Zn-dependent alcohol dehydrogenase